MHIFILLQALIVAVVATTSISQSTCCYSQNSYNKSAQECAVASILAQGIALNIADQRQEQAALARVKAVLDAPPVDCNTFATAKANLLQFVVNGIAIRQTNQLITPPGNAATAGLAIVRFPTLLKSLSWDRVSWTNTDFV